ncbi:SDR family oxidoreductase [Microvirga flavescens]|uniref:SDR family oxidoreductase n=1 Tax=Microvirga flavescens TaxID=2249811 RepID=UPI000DD64956|nr:SDR family oxidoreductase [Microvirga flavescens]
MAGLNGKTILVVGGTSGIGLAAAQRFAEDGARVVVASRSATNIEAAARALGNGTKGRVLDTTDDAAVEAFFSDGTVYDHIVISAAKTPRGPVRDLALADAQSAMNSKFWGSYRTVRAAVRANAISKQGSVTFVSGFLSVRPSKTAALQGAINAALEALGRGLALELAPIRVNTASPGFVDTPLWGDQTTPEHQALLAKMAGSLPASLAGKPEHVAIQIEAFLTNPYITGTTVLVDGGGAIA